MKNEGLTTRKLKCRNQKDQDLSIEYCGAKSEIIYLTC